VSTFLALRKLAGSDGGEERPVGSAGVEERPDAVVGEAAESEGDAFDTLQRMIASVGPFETRARRQFTIAVCQRPRVRPRRRSSGGLSVSVRSVASSPR